MVLSSELYGWIIFLFLIYIVYSFFLHLQFHYSFKFTKLDHNNPDKPFTFALLLDPDTDLYELTDCNPSLDQKDIDDVINVMNADKSNGFNGLVVSMRKLFKKTL